MKKIYYLLMLTALSLGVTSCDGWDSPYYVDDVVGSWESSWGYDGYYEYDIRGFDVVRYDFYANYTGRYTYYNSYYGYSYVDFDWETRGDRLFIRYYDGDREYLYYGFDHSGYLILSLDRNFYRYTAYRPTGMYWEQFKENAEKQGLQVKKETSRSVTKEVATAKE